MHAPRRLRDLDAPPCVVGVCVEGACQPRTVSGPCDDGDACTTADACAATGCLGRPWTAAELVGWQVLFDGPGDDVVTGLAVHPSGQVTVVGAFEGTAALAGAARTARGDGTLPDAFVARLSATGALLWLEQLGGGGLDVAWDVTPVGEDAVVIGCFEGSATFGQGA